MNLQERRAEIQRRIDRSVAFSAVKDIYVPAVGAVASTLGAVGLIREPREWGAAGLALGVVAFTASTREAINSRREEARVIFQEGYSFAIEKCAHTQIEPTQPIEEDPSAPSLQ